ncbi:dipeptide/oligopeptide/nickel ABC transporter ATP-binding protein [Sphaerisporangium melleum]|uniref:Dipeptide/oligopeptide/nickel ABC transporter ATP-binding protein n=1 Tax=Sphaerisporangium melleum TaxID=321316 RepID=A0A917R1P7_9ACTN|nr:ABC transporter ATP-binding protein [Sphaerisporangium melleum]GGK84864.1 dipeptide/oligopeptide/nickel ABC transporter ATP-binding protein [Sphaerisporangium melleum]GII70464.1 dipeptide/oligopeptide/nickel ABC transporter ATP-binding protein [Sphaerisporangium melleum]
MTTTLTVTDLSKHFPVRDGRRRRTLRAVDGVSFTLTAGRTTALVGESGSGKSTIVRVLARLTRPTSGEILLDGDPVRSTRRYRKDVQMVFQDPFASLNPAHTVGHHLRRPLRIHGVTGDVRHGVHELLERVNLTPAEVYARRYPHELSGGQRQRVAIARALAPRPKVLLADEPVSMLDVSIRLEILNLIDRLKREQDLAVLYVTHDLATARYFSSEIMVMYGGRIVERGPADEVILRPAHPYTRLLESAAPDPATPRAARERDDGDAAARRRGVRPPLPQAGCPFRPRCPHATDACAGEIPTVAVGEGHQVACLLHAGAPSHRS